LTAKIWRGSLALSLLSSSRESRLMAGRAGGKTGGAEAGGKTGGAEAGGKAGGGAGGTAGGGGAGGGAGGKAGGAGGIVGGAGAEIKVEVEETGEGGAIRQEEQEGGNLIELEDQEISGLCLFNQDLPKMTGNWGRLVTWKVSCSECWRTCIDKSIS